MATSSITKEFVIRDEKACKRLAKVLSQPTKRKKSNSPSRYEEGKKKLAQYLYH